ncbi:MAG: hypothetical protein QOK01_2453, partial [Alphaproteobacteria bacterium]|nr:hypothetical protein [Alphaproteobacteria bacterium]
MANLSLAIIAINGANRLNIVFHTDPGALSGEGARRELMRP